MTRKTVKNYEQSIASSIKSNPKLFWQNINFKLKSNQSVSNLKTEDGNITANDSEKPEVLNRAFVGVFTKEDTNSIPEPLKLKFSKPLETITFDKDSIKKKLKNLNPT